MKNNNLHSTHNSHIIGIINNYMKKLDENPDLREKIKVHREEKGIYGDWMILQLIKSTNDSAYIKDILENKDTREKLGLLDSDVSSLLDTVIDLDQSVEYIQDMLENHEKRESTGLNQRCLLKRILYEDYYCKDSHNYVENFIENVDYNTNGNNNIIINLPENMTIGVEIESENDPDLNEIITNVKNKAILEEGWEFQEEETIRGCEVTSPILTGNNTRSSDSIRKVCNVLKNMGQEATYRCGGHVHIGADYLTKPESWQNLIEIWGNTEKILFAISNKAGEIPHFQRLQYIRPISGNMEKELENGFVGDDNILGDTKTIHDFIIATQPSFKDIVDRDYAINGSNVLSNRNEPNPRNTIEFRLANGTLDPNTWIENINLFGGIVRASQDLALIQEKDESQRSEEEQKMIESFEKLKDSDISEQEKLEHLLIITIPKQNRDIYVQRYVTNSKLMEENQEVQQNINRNIAKKTISIRDIGKNIFTGPNAITGQEYMKGSRIIESFLELDNIRSFDDL